MDDFGPLLWIIISIIAFIFNKMKGKDEDESWSDSWTEEWEEENTSTNSKSSSASPTHLDEKIQINQEYKAWRQEQENLAKDQRHQELISERDALRAKQTAEDEHEHRALNIMAKAKIEEAQAKTHNPITAQEIVDKPHLPLHQLRLQEKEELRRAILLKNILDKPKALL